MRIIFVRHGEPDYNTDSLTEKGKLDANLLAERVKSWNVKDIYVSPQGRAIETAAPSLKVLNKDAITLPWIREFSYPVNLPFRENHAIPWDFTPSYLHSNDKLTDLNEWVNADPIAENKDIKIKYKEVTDNLDELLEKYGYRRKDKYYERMDGRERFLTSTVIDNRYATVDSFPEDDSEPTIVMFCHLGIICLMLSHLLNIPFELLTHGFFLPTTSLTIVNTEERWGSEVSFRVQSMGDVSHLLNAGVNISNAGSFARSFQK